jgi:hypothetical protein
VPPQAPAAAAAPASLLGTGTSATAPQAPHALGSAEVHATRLLLLGADANCRFSETQIAALGAFMETRAVQPGSQVTYRQVWKLWAKKFLPSLPLDQRPCNVFMDDVVGDFNRALYVLAFGKYLYEARGWRGRQVTRNFTHLRHHFFAAVRDTKFLDHPLVGKARDAVQMDHEERIVDIQRRVDSAILPLTYPLLDLAKEQFWTSSPWDTDKGRLRKATYLAGSMLMDTGNRVSNATGPTTDKLLGIIADHGVKTAQLEIVVYKPVSKTTFSLHGAPGVRGYLLNPNATAGATVELRYPNVLSMTITFLTQKVVKDDEGPPEPLFYARRQPRESRYMDDVMDWLLFNDKLRKEDYLFTTYQRSPKPNAPTDKRLLQRRDVATMVKTVAAAMGFDPKRFSTSSARRFAASSKGLSMAEIKARGGWNPNSTVTERHYRRDGQGRGVFAVAEGQGEFSHEQLKGLARKPLDTCPDISSGDEIADDDDDDYDMEELDEGEGTGDDEGSDGGLEGLQGGLGSLASAGVETSSPVVPSGPSPPQSGGKKRARSHVVAHPIKALKPVAVAPVRKAFQRSPPVLRRRGKGL